MIKIKLLRESKLLKEGREGLYDIMGVAPGSIDLFLEVFTSGNQEHTDALRSFISSQYQQFIDNLTEQDIPETSERSYKTPLNKVKLFLSKGVTYWWFMVAGPQVAQKIIRFQVISYYMELEDELERIGYQDLTTETFDNLSQKDKNLVYEKHFWEDYLDTFFANQMSKEASGNLQYIGGKDQTSGLYGMMKDWWMSTTGRDMMQQEMSEARDELYLDLRKDTEPETVPDQKTPQWFKKGDPVGYDNEEDVPDSEER
tara:strand:- start:334 stop:1104 length:771 start_codon:yes stop_codon:yes gene_type:complete